MSSIKTIESINLSELEKLKFTYQEKLTEKIDDYNGDFDQNIINEIVLWKVNRYAELKPESIKLLNLITKEHKDINITLTKNILHELLHEKGIRLAMASTILRFKNQHIYQIIDQRVYRLIYGKELAYKENNIEEQICLYLKYLEDLKLLCVNKKIDFTSSDRILYLADKKLNKELKLKGF